MSRESQKTIEEVLRVLPVADRLSALLISIIERNPDALAVSLCMLNATTTLSKRLSAANRVKVAEAMRDRADVLERRQVVPIA
jgi:hypothetical protein